MATFCRWLGIGWIALWAGAGMAGELLPGEFADIDLGRPLLEPKRFPTLSELRRAVAKPQIEPVLMFKLLGNDKNHHLPVWSGDGRRLACQRSEVDVRSSRLLLFPSMSQLEPTLLSEAADAYDYMFRWVANSPSSYVYVRILPGGAGTQVRVAADGAPAEIKLEGARFGFPTAYRRTDGIWRLVYQRDGTLMQQAWNAQGPLEKPLLVMPGSFPQWSSDGSRLLLARQRIGGGAADLEMIVLSLRSEKTTLLPPGLDGLARSPSWSPDEQRAAFYVRAAGEGKPWRIRVCPASAAGDGLLLGNDVVVNPTFDSEGPTWEPSGRRVWFFSNEHRKQAYYPLVAGDVETGELSVIDYPGRCTTPNDLAINPANTVPELAFVGHETLPQDLFILFLNHY